MHNAEETSVPVSYLRRAGKPALAYRYSPPDPQKSHWPLVMFCGGYKSDMEGTKATWLEAQCRARGQGFLRFDYSGHGRSEGAFEDGTIGAWMEDALTILDEIAQGPVLLVGSSMGGWIALLLARARAGKVQGLIGIAAAPDFTEELYALRLSDAQKIQLAEQGYAEIPNDYSDEPYHFTKNFYEEAKEHLLLTHSQTVDFPLRLIQGMQDKDVPWETALKIQKNYDGPEIDTIFVDDGDHSLSRPEDLTLIDKEIKSLSGIL
ncbi:MAG: alpha/beta hydrolase [Alphaproteobacteria bacterium]|nr:alpha/beta hydrolase [Alphaproteobacteria bacterium]